MGVYTHSLSHFALLRCPLMGTRTGIARMEEQSEEVRGVTRFLTRWLITFCRLFFGKKRQRLLAVSPTDDARHQSSIHEKEDLFTHLHVNVADEGFDLYDGLARYFDDVVEIGGEKKRMEVSLVDLPPLLQIQLQV